MITLPIVQNRFPLIVAAGAAVCLTAVAIIGAEIGGAGIVAFAVVRSLLVVVQGLVLVGLVYSADRRLRLARAQ
ncbi:MAG TPA: hypothetical protein VL475_09055 [Planctomycetaceae bacterium]|nr:hypothetical protein [Planctomycetaceae bacterium]